MPLKYDFNRIEKYARMIHPIASFRDFIVKILAKFAKNDYKVIRCRKERIL